MFELQLKLFADAARAWAESFGSQPDSDDEERIDVELAVNSVIASKKRQRA